MGSIAGWGPRTGVGSMAGWRPRTGVGVYGRTGTQDMVQGSVAGWGPRTGAYGRTLLTLLIFVAFFCQFNIFFSFARCVLTVY